MAALSLFADPMHGVEAANHRAAPPVEVPEGLVLFCPEGAVPDRAEVARAVERLEREPHLAAVVDLPRSKAEFSLHLDLMLHAVDVTALLVRREVAAACEWDPLPEDALTTARMALRVACAFEVERSEVPLARRTDVPRPSDADRAALVRQGVLSFGIEDLYPVLRTPGGVGRFYATIHDCAARSFEAGGRADGYVLGAWAEAMAEERDRGLPLPLEGMSEKTSEQRSAPEQSSCGILRVAAPDPLVTLIVPTLNRRAMLGRALQSVAAQTFSDLEVVVVNDGGVDPGDMLETFRSVIGGGDRVTLVHHDRNRGLAAARNTGLRLARGRYVGFLDDDDVLLPHHLAALLPHLKIGARVAHADSRSVFEQVDQPLPHTRGHGIVYQDGYAEATFLIDNVLPVQSVLCERVLLEEVGGFDERLPVLEDWDLWIRVFERSAPPRVARITSELRLRTDGSNMTTESADLWAETQAEIYGKTLDRELAIPGLRAARVRYLLDRVSRSGVGFPEQASRWLRGRAGLVEIDSRAPLGGLE